MPGGRSGLQEGAERLCGRPGSALQTTAERESGPPFRPPFPRPRAPSPPPRPRRRKPGLHLPARRVRPAPGLAQTPAARLCASGHAPQPLSGRAPFPLPSPWVPGPTAALPLRYPPPLLFPPPPALCSRLWGWARDVKPSVASARLAGAGHQKSNVLFPNYPLSVREQGRTGWELNVKYPLQAGSIIPGIQPQPPAPLCQLQTTQTKRGLRDLLFFQGGWGWAGAPHPSAARLGDRDLIKMNNATSPQFCALSERRRYTGRPSHKSFLFVF